MNDRWDIGRVAAFVLGVGLAFASATTASAQEPVRRFAVDRWARPHHVAPTADGAVWYTAQAQGALGRLDPATGEIETVPLGARSNPRGVFVGPDGALWVTDSGLNAIVRVDPQSRELTTFALPRRGLANLHGAAFDAAGQLWFAGQAGIYGRLDPTTGEIEVWRAPLGPGPTAMTATPAGDIYFTTYNGNYLVRVDPKTGEASLIEPPAPLEPVAGAAPVGSAAPGISPAESGSGLAQPGSAAGTSMTTALEPRPSPDDWPVGPLGVGSDSQGRIWVAERIAGRLAVYDPADGSWQEWTIPIVGSEPYALWVDDQDKVWLSDVSVGGIIRFDPETERFERRRGIGSNALIYHISGRHGEVWAADTIGDRILLLPTD